MFARRKKGFERFIQRVPHGTVFVLSPWNYPYLTAVNAVIPALLSGNTVILKPSDQTLWQENTLEAFQEAGLPEVYFDSSHESQAAHVLADDCIDYVAFTGSVEGGVAVSQALANRAGRNRFIGVALSLAGMTLPMFVRMRIWPRGSQYY